MIAQAQTSSPVAQPVITSILDGLTLDIGTGYDVKNKTWVETDTVRFLEYAKTDNTGNYSGFLNYIGKVDPRLSIGYSSADKIVVGGAIKLIAPSQFGLTSPLLNAISLSPFAQYSFYHIGSNLSDIKNSWIFGAYIVKGSI